MALISNEPPVKERRHGVGAEVEGQPRQLTGEHPGHTCVCTCANRPERPRWSRARHSWEPTKDKLPACPAVRGGDEGTLPAPRTPLPGPASCQLHPLQPTHPPPSLLISLCASPEAPFTLPRV